MSAQFHSLDELLARTKGNGWDSIVSLFREEYSALDFLGSLPRSQRMAQPLSQYEEDLGCFYHFLHGTPHLDFWKRPRNAMIRGTLERIRAEEGSVAVAIPASRAPGR